jgi:competence protein ComGC
MFVYIRNERGNWTLIGLLVCLVIGLGLLVFLFLSHLSPGEQARKEGLVQPKEGQTVLGASIDKAKDTQCAGNLRQIRMMIDSYKAENGQWPASLQDLRMQVAPDFFKCPTSGRDYQYDPASGKISCPTPGHEGF